MTFPKRNASPARRERRRKLEAEMLALMQEARNGEKIDSRWLSVAGVFS